MNVPRIRNRSCFLPFTVFVLLVAAASVVHADPIGASYNVTDLGSGPVTLSTSNGGTFAIPQFVGNSGMFVNPPPGGGQYTTVSNGTQTYSFTFAPATPLTPNQGITTNYPFGSPAPNYERGPYGDPAYHPSSVVSAITNSNGIAVAIVTPGGDGQPTSGTAYYSQHNADGSWSSPALMWQGNGQYNGNLGLSVVGLNNLNQVLGTMSIGQYNQYYASVLYDINTHTLTNLSALALTGPLSGYVYYNIVPVAIDDSGRILLQAAPYGGSTIQGEQTLLLTPTDLPGNPVPAPEPGSFAVMALAAAAFAWHRIRERRRRG